MDLMNKNRRNRYDRVMPRVNNQPRFASKSSSLVTRHDKPSSVRVGAKPSVSNASSSVFSELPTVLNDFVPESSKKVNKTFVIKPRKTIKSLDPAKVQLISNPKELNKKPSSIRVPVSAPSVLRANGDKWSETHLKDCLSSRSHSRLKELKNEIHAYHETEKLMRIRSSLLKKCGVVLDDVGNIAADKAVQVEELISIDPVETPKEIRTERSTVREDAGTFVSDQQMRSVNMQYPVDRYMVESSKKYEIVNIIDDDLWNTEPALKPEDEIILRKLHEMLQSTADDLKRLSGELTKFHEPGVQVKTAPTPLDEEFNEKVHIEEIVNAKFHGYKIIDKPSLGPENVLSPKDNIQKSNKNNANTHLNSAPIVKKPLSRNLGVTRTKVIQIDGNQDSTETEKLNKSRVVNAPVAYSEYSYKYVEPTLDTPCKNLKVQAMPSINIRSELKEQKVLQLDILPENSKSEKSDMVTKNVAVVAVQHEEPPKPVLNTTITHEYNKIKQTIKPLVRKVSKMSPCESSVSNISSDTQIKLKTQKRLLTNIVRSNLQREMTKNESEKRSQSNLNEWRKKLNIVYGPSSSRTKVKNKSKVSPKKKNTTQNASSKSSALNNAEYIPYSKLTIGGAKASDIEREISKIPNENKIPLSPILDKIIGSQENSFVEKNRKKHKNDDKLKVLTTSDENLLQEVIDIEKTVSETLSKNIKNTDSDPKVHPLLSDTDETKENESYVDDFEDEKSDNSGQLDQNKYSSESSKICDNAIKSHSVSKEKIKDKEVKNIKAGPSTSNINIHNLTYAKVPKLSLKNKVDIFEFVQPVVTQDSATQSIGIQRISPKETQTTPRSETNVQPIHNDLWPTIDPKGQVEKMFELEKDFIKKLIFDEYGDILEKNLTKPSTSEEVNKNKVNVAASQKNTQTSPAHVKNVMTSPTRTKTRTTSPIVTVSVDHHTSPLVLVTDENDTKLETKLTEKDLDISVNLSSPRFSLRLPRSFQEVFSNSEGSVPRTTKKHVRVSSEARKNTIGARNAKKNNLNRSISSTSSREADSSDLSSLGEVKLRRILEKNIVRKISSDCESVFSLSSSNYTSEGQSGILPLRSEGEMSLGLIRKSNKHSKSEGEASFGMLL